MNRFIEVTRLENGERILLNESDVSMLRESIREDRKRVTYIHTDYYPRGLAIREPYKKILQVLGLKGIIKSQKETD